MGRTLVIVLLVVAVMVFLTTNGIKGFDFFGFLDNATGQTEFRFLEKLEDIWNEDGVPTAPGADLTPLEKWFVELVSFEWLWEFTLHLVDTVDLIVEFINWYNETENTLEVWQYAKPIEIFDWIDWIYIQNGGIIPN